MLIATIGHLRAAKSIKEAHIDAWKVWGDIPDGCGWINKRHTTFLGLPHSIFGNHLVSQWLSFVSSRLGPSLIAARCVSYLSIAYLWRLKTYVIGDWG